MACILNIETSTDVCSVALANDGQIVCNEECRVRANHAEKIPLFIEKALYCMRSGGLRLDAVAVSGGPGSYTGLRIGVSSAKGVCYGSGAQLLSVPTTEVMCVPVLRGHKIEDNALLCPMIDARRMEVYAMISDKNMIILREVKAEVVDASTYKKFLDGHIVYFFGNGAEKCKGILTHSNARFIDGINPMAGFMPALSEKKYSAGIFEDIAYFAPFYLKEFHTVIPKNKL